MEDFKTVEEIERHISLLSTELQALKQVETHLKSDIKRQKEYIKMNKDKLKLNQQLPYLVSTVCEIFDSNTSTGLIQETDGANVNIDSKRKGKCAVIKTSTRQTIFLPVIGLVKPEELKPGDLVGTNRDSYLILEKLPAEFDSRAKAMIVDEKPKDTFESLGGLGTQIREIIEAVVLPITAKDRYKKIGIKPPKGVLLYGPPGTGKTQLARACAAQSGCVFLKLAAPQLVQMYIGDGAKIVRDAFELAKQKAPAIIFIDELDAIGIRRSDNDQHGEREVQRTMLELLSQLDGFHSHDDIKVLAATNRIDVLDPALLRSGRLDRKVEFPLPDEHGRGEILEIHAKKMNLDESVNFAELAKCCPDMNGAQLKAICIEAGMLAIRRDMDKIGHEDFLDGISAVQAKKKMDLNYYA